MKIMGFIINFLARHRKLNFIMRMFPEYIQWKIIRKRAKIKDSETLKIHHKSRQDIIFNIEGNLSDVEKDRIIRAIEKIFTEHLI